MLKLLKSLFKSLAKPFVKIFRYFFPKNNRVKPDSFSLPQDAVPLASSLPELFRVTDTTVLRPPENRILTKQEIIDNYYYHNPVLRDISLAYHIVSDTAKLLKNKTRSVSDINNLVNNHETFDLDRFLSLLTSQSMNFYRDIRNKISADDVNPELQDLLKFELSLVAMARQSVTSDHQAFHPDINFMSSYYSKTKVCFGYDQIFEQYVMNFLENFYHARCHVFKIPPNNEIFTNILKSRIRGYNTYSIINLDPTCSPTSPRPSMI